MATFNYFTVPQLPWTQTYRWSAAAIFDDPENPLDDPSPDRIDIRNTDGSRTIIYGTGLARDLSSGFVTRIGHTTEDQLTSYFDVFGFQVHASELKVGGSAAVGDLLSIILAGDDLLFDRTTGPSSEGSVVLTGYAGHDTFNSQGLALIDGGPNPSGVPIRNALNYESIDGSLTVLQAAYGTRGTASLPNGRTDSFAHITDIFLGDGDDWVGGRIVAEVLRGSGGDDTFRAQGGSDSIDGGDGSDTVIYSWIRVGALVVDLDSGVASYVDPRGVEVPPGTFFEDTLMAVENVIGSPQGDLMEGSFAANRMNGFGGADFLDGRGGDDSLTGHNGNDTLVGGSGADRLVGGAGRDTASYATSHEPVVASLLQPGRNSGDAAGDTYVTIENLTGGGGVRQAHRQRRAQRGCRRIGRRLSRGPGRRGQPLRRGGTGRAVRRRGPGPPRRRHRRRPDGRRRWLGHLWTGEHRRQSGGPDRRDQVRSG